MPYWQQQKGVNFSMTKPTQQDFLRDAMQSLNMTRQNFADRIGARKRALDNWLLPSNSNGFRSMPDTIWILVREILLAKK
jgi:aspartate carbamoyltransferase catalytic subunit